MLIIESDRIVSIAISAGFCSGCCQSFLDYILDKGKLQLLSNKQLIAKLLYCSFSLAIILGVMAFALSAWDTDISSTELNRFTIAMAVFFAITPLSDRILSFLLSRLKLFH